MTICGKFKLDIHCRQDLEEGLIPKGCICCVHCDSFGHCRATGRGKDLGDGHGYLSLSGKIETLEDDQEESDE